MKTQISIAIKMLIIMTMITGVAYPLFVTGVAQSLFYHRANGSLVIKDGKIIGSELIGQKFDSAAYFWSRPSAVDYNPLPSGGSNLGPTSNKQKRLVQERRIKFIASNTLKDSSYIPCEMITASASGLDPHISPEAAMLQTDRVARARNFTTSQKKQVINLIQRKTEYPQFLLFGEKRINVFLLNLELDKIR